MNRSIVAAKRAFSRGKGLFQVEEEDESSFSAGSQEPQSEEVSGDSVSDVDEPVTQDDYDPDMEDFPDFTELMEKTVNLVKPAVKKSLQLYVVEGHIGSVDRDTVVDLSQWMAEQIASYVEQQLLEAEEHASASAQLPV